MILPFNGRVVVIDDREDEGIPLLKTLSKYWVSVAYFTGKLDELPEQPFTDVRLVFLDIVLGTEGQDEKTKLSTALSIIEKVVNKEKNGPFILIAWTKHKELVEKMKQKLQEEKYQIVMIDLEKYIRINNS